MDGLPVIVRFDVFVQLAVQFFLRVDFLTVIVRLQVEPFDVLLADVLFALEIVGLFGGFDTAGQLVLEQAVGELIAVLDEQFDEMRVTGDGVQRLETKEIRRDAVVNGWREDKVERRRFGEAEESYQHTFYRSSVAKT